MRLTLGRRAYDLTSRALVIARAADPAAGGPALVEEGADLVEATEPDHVAALIAVLDVPVAIAARRLDAVRAAYQAGAVLGTCPDPAFLALSAEVGAAVVTPDPAPALAAGIPTDRIAFEVPAGTLPPAGSPYPVLVTTDDIGAAALAITLGARLIRTHDVRAMRRVADVLAAILAV